MLLGSMEPSGSNAELPYAIDLSLLPAIVDVQPPVSGSEN